MRQQTYLRRAHIASKGGVTDWAYRWHTRHSPHKPGPAKSSLFVQANENDIVNAVSSLQLDGVAIWPYPMPADWVDRVKSFLAKSDATARGDSQDIQQPSQINPKYATYWHTPEQLYENNDLVSFFSDNVLREVIERYLGCHSVFDFATAWWTYPTKTPDSAAAQLYHFDYDRVRWVKVFCYLTDVDSSNGPHSVVRKSHESSAKLALRDGRFSDSEINKLGLGKDIVNLTGAAGTVFLEDTRAFHKGTPVTKGLRCVVEYERSVSHYGYPHPECLIP